MVRLAVIDDDPTERKLVGAIFSADPTTVVQGYELGLEGVRAVVASPPDAVLLDLHLPDVSGMEALQQIRAAHPHLPVLIVTADHDIKLAVEAMRAGAFHFVTKPFNHDELQVLVRRSVLQAQTLAELEHLRRRLDQATTLGLLLGLSKPIQAVAKQITQVAPTSLGVLIQGETGTGKDLVARAIHEESGRSGPLVAVDCGALPETLAESMLFGHERGAFSGAERRQEGHVPVAEGGTLFLDEIGNLPHGIQAKLLRVLQDRTVRPLGAAHERRVDFRVVAATNVELAQAVERGEFRQDLYYRVREFVIELAPLRERPDDIAILARRFCETASMELHRPVAGFTDAAMRMLREYAWPGNVRELRNVVRQAVLGARGLLVEVEDIGSLVGSRDGEAAEAPAPLQIPVTPGLPLREITERAASEAERQAIAHALRVTQGNRTRAAQLLHIDARTLYSKIKKYGLLP